MNYAQPENIFWLLGTGVAAGFFGALLGVGGGILLIPLLVLAFHVPIHFAIGTSIVTVIATSSMAGSFNLERGAVNIRLGMVLEVATAVGALGGGTLAGLVPGRVLVSIFGMILAPIGWLMWRKGGGPTMPVGSEMDYRLRRLPAAMGLSLGAGAISGLLGIGGGIIKVPALTLLCNVPPKVATATSTFMIGVTAVASAFLYFGRGQVRPAMTAIVILGVLAGSAAGTQVGRQMHGRFVVRLFSVLVWFAAVQMLYRGLVGMAR